MKRTVFLSLAGVGLMSLRFLMGWNSARFYPDKARLLEEMNLAASQASELKLLRDCSRRETVQRIAADPMHRYGGQLGVAGK